jgi:hypothetical protein
MFNKHLREDLDKIKHQLDFNIYRDYFGGYRVLIRERNLQDVITSLEFRLSEPEKLTRMILAHLGVEYAKTTEETATGKQEKEVLRKIKKQKSAKAS